VSVNREKGASLIVPGQYANPRQRFGQDFHRKVTVNVVPGKRFHTGFEIGGFGGTGSGDNVVSMF
jgi:hypothetical protein